MSAIDPNRLIFIVVGVQLPAELGDRPLAYRIAEHVQRMIDEKIGKSPEGQLPRLAPAVISDVYYLNNENIQHRPAISVGGPGVNGLSGQLVNELPTIIAIENTLILQMDLDVEDPRVSVWGMDHILTVRAVELMIDKGHLEHFVNKLIEQLPEEDE